MTTLMEIVKEEMEDHNENHADVQVILIGPTSEYRDDYVRKFVDDVYVLGSYEGSTGHGVETFPGFRMWTDNRVYFKVVYDSAEWIESVPKVGDLEASTHDFGGG
jgi:hypothetical protein